MAADVAAHKVLVSIGTDAFGFDRLVTWIDNWLRTYPLYRPQTLVQHGQTRSSIFANNVPFMTYEELLGAMARAQVVVVHGGPATIMESRGQGRIPLCVPRSPSYREVVDGHQERFARKLEAEGLIFLAEDESTFRETLASLLEHPERAVTSADGERGREAAANLSKIIHELRERKSERRKGAFFRFNGG